MSNQQVQAAPTTPMQEFRRSWESNKVEIAKQLPTGVDPERFMRTVITTVTADPGLLEANRSSLFTACMQSAKDGLLPDGREATIQIYNTNIAKYGQPDQWVKMAQYMPMVRGLIKQMYEAGCTKVDGYAVYQMDVFQFSLGDDSSIVHQPYMGAEDAGPVVAAYAIVRLENGEIKREVMPRRDIEKVREASKAPDGPGWSKWYDQFAIKAVLKRIYKQVPGRSDEFEKLMDTDNAAMGFVFDHKADADISGITGEGLKVIEEKDPVSVQEHIDEKLGREPTRAEKLKAQLAKDGIATSLASELDKTVDLDERSEDEQRAAEEDLVPGPDEPETAPEPEEMTDEAKAFVDDMEKEEK
jgi:recombination protein RecT